MQLRISAIGSGSGLVGRLATAQRMHLKSEPRKAHSVDPNLMVMAQSQARLCSVFANSKRIMILWSLAEGEKPVTVIAQAIGASLQCTSQHLSLMKTAGVLEARREGQTIYYRIGEEFMGEGCQVILEKRRELLNC